MVYDIIQIYDLNYIINNYLTTPFRFINAQTLFAPNGDNKWITVQSSYYTVDGYSTDRVALQIDSTGKITGYPLAPVLSDDTPTTKTYTFTLQLTSSLGNNTQTYSIIVKNQRLSRPVGTRKPVILNGRPRFVPLQTTDVYYDYYVGTDNIIPNTRANEHFAYKIIGYDFDGSVLEYIFTNLPSGLSGDINTGWVTGVVTMPADGIS